MSRKRPARTHDTDRDTQEIEALLRAGHWEPARDRAEALVQRDDHAPVAHSLLSRALFFLGQSTRALQSAERACELGPDDPTLRSRLGALCAATGRLDAAIEHCRAALAIDPNESGARVNLALALSQTHRRTEAIDALAPLASSAALASATRQSALDLLAELQDEPRARALRERLESVRAEDSTTAPPAAVATAHRTVHSFDSVVDRVGRDLCALARSNKLERPTGRDAEIEQVIDILCRRRKSNPCLVGAAGVGKTAIVEALAHRIAQGSVPAQLRNARIIEVSMASLTAGTSLRGELEARLHRLLDELRGQRSTILFLDEVHTLVASSGAAGQLNVAEMLKPAMARGELSLIGATTDEGYERSIQRDPALARRFERVRVGEPDEGSLRLIMRASAREFARHHGVSIDDDAIVSCLSLCARWLADRRMPDVGVDALDRACVRAHRAGLSVVSQTHIEDAVATMAGTSVEQLRATPSSTLALVQTALQSTLVGHEQTLRALAETYALAVVRDPRQRRPRAVLWINGPASVGKHTSLRALAQSVDRPIVQFDLATVSERHDVAKLIGTAAGFVGYDDGAPLLRALRASPNAILCFDNPEQAHPDARVLVANALREGSLADARGDSADLRRACVVFVTHRSEATRARAGFSLSEARAQHSDATDALGAALAATLDAALTFEAISREQRRELVQRFLDEGARSLAAHAVHLRIDESALDTLAEANANARELRARCEREVFGAALRASERGGANVTVRGVRGRVECVSE